MLGLFSAERLTFVRFSPDDGYADAVKKVVFANQNAYYHGLCLHDKVLELGHERDEKIVAVRDVEFSFHPYIKNHQTDFIVEWIPNFAPEVSMEFTVSNASDENDYLMIADYRSDLFNEVEIKTFFNEINLLIENIVRGGNKKI